MPRNVEIKAKIESLENALKSASALCSGISPVIINQHDTFFSTKCGRLKLREFPLNKQSKSELIYYNRPDGAGPKISDYVKIMLDDANSMRELLTITNGKIGKVKKTRYLYIYDRTRIHIDSVEGLGTYLELEVCLRDDESLEDGSVVAHKIMEQLQIPHESLVTGAYMDALLR